MPESTPAELLAPDPRLDFDSFFGTWRVINRRLMERLREQVFSADDGTKWETDRIMESTRS